MCLHYTEDDAGKYPGYTEVEERGLAVDFARKDGGKEDKNEADMTTCNLKKQEADLIASEFCETVSVSVHWLRGITCAYVRSCRETSEGWLQRREGAAAGSRP